MAEYLEKFRPHLRNMINNFKISTEWNLHLKMKPKSVLPTDSNEKHTMHSKGDNHIIMIGNDIEEIIQELFDHSGKNIK